MDTFLRPGGAISDYSGPLVPRRRLAAELRRLREDSRLTGDTVARHLNWSASKVSRYELARTGLKPGEVARLLDLYQVTGAARTELLGLATDAAKKGWWDAFADVLPEELTELIGLETDAKAALSWQIECVPGLLQTEQYAHHVNRGYRQVVGMPPTMMDRRVRARLLRQQILTRDRPLRLSVVIDESALLRGVADAPVMRAQMSHLLEVSRRSNVAIHVLPLAGIHDTILPSFVVLEFDAATLPDVVYAEHLVVNHYFDGEADTYHYKEAYQRLVSAALSPADSRGLISDIAQKAWSG